MGAMMRILGGTVLTGQTLDITPSMIVCKLISRAINPLQVGGSVILPVPGSTLCMVGHLSISHHNISKVLITLYYINDIYNFLEEKKIGYRLAKSIKKPSYTFTR